MGFHPDFTGRQNAYMSGQLLGLSVEEITALMPEIESFAELGDYIDQPVRVYSSGMQVRLAFSVATARRPDVLIVDEALSVGDAYFQHKSFDRIRSFKKQGTTLLIVSHDKQAIQSICNRAILLNEGHLAMEGEPEAVMDYYNALLADPQGVTVKQEVALGGKKKTMSGTGEGIIKEICLLNEQGQPVVTINVGQLVNLKVLVEARKDISELILGYLIKDRLGQPVFGTNTYHLNKKLYDVAAGTIINFNFCFTASIGPGTYAISSAIHANDTHNSKNYEWRDLAITFNVVNIDKETFVGAAWLPPTLETQLSQPIKMCNKLKL
jgi:lipopolysaccharide transport system ATP-binding protein